MLAAPYQVGVAPAHHTAVNCFMQPNPAASWWCASRKGCRGSPTSMDKCQGQCQCPARGPGRTIHPHRAGLRSVLSSSGWLLMTRGADRRVCTALAATLLPWALISRMRLLLRQNEKQLHKGAVRSGFDRNVSLGAWHMCGWLERTSPGMTTSRDVWRGTMTPESNQIEHLL